MAGVARRRAGSALLVVAAVTMALLPPGASSSAATATKANRPLSLTTHPSPRDWAGLVAEDTTAPALHGVVGTWKVPTVFCTPHEHAAASEWVGIGGDYSLPGSESIEPLHQAGIETDCADGAPRYYPWRQAAGTPDLLNRSGAATRAERCIAEPIHPGDTVHVAVLDQWPCSS